MPLHEDSNDRRSPAEVRLTQETIDYMTELVQQAVRQAVSEGIKGAITEDTAARFWSAGMQALQRQATHRAGRMVLGGLAGMLSRGAMFLLLGGIVYAVGGWALLAKLAKALFSAGG